MYEQVISFFEAHKKILLTILIYIVCFGITFLAGYMLGLRAGSESISGDAVDGTIQQLNADNAAARTEIDRANATIADLKSQLGAASTATDAISTGLSKAQDSATKISDINKQCLNIVGQCQQDNDKAKSVLSAAQRSNQGGASQGKTAANQDGPVVSGGRGSP